LLTNSPISSPPSRNPLPRPQRLSTSVQADGPTLLSAHLAQVQEAIRVVCKLQSLTRDDAEELTSLVYLKLLQDDGAVLRGFRGESNLRTFLVVVVRRVLLDSWIARYGKWRPSADARRLGPVAIELERLVYRDGMTLTEAAETIRVAQGVSDTDDELAFLLSLLPTRRLRRFVSDSNLTPLASFEPSPLELLLARSAPSPIALIQKAIATLSVDDRQLMSLRFVRNLTIREIALRRGLEPRALYRRFDRLLRRMRTAVTKPS